MDPAAPLDLSHASGDIITAVLQSMSLSDRFTCALVCKAWAEAATAARSIILRDRVDNLSCLQLWLEKHGNQLEVLQLHECRKACLSDLPCPQLQDLLLHGWDRFNISSRVWSDIAAATKLTAASFVCGSAASHQADVVSALTALPDLEQLTLSYAGCGGSKQLSDSALLQQLTKLTALELTGVTSAALEQLGSLTKLQYLRMTYAEERAAAGFPGLQELKALTRLGLNDGDHFPASVSQLTALQQLHVSAATPAALNGLQALTGLTQLSVEELRCHPPEFPPLQLPGLQHLEIVGSRQGVPMSLLSRCTQLRVLCVQDLSFAGPGSLVASTMLQRLELIRCSIPPGVGAAAPVSWQQVISAAGQLPLLTSLKLTSAQPALELADVKCVVSCCSSLQALHLGALQDGFAPALMRLSGLTSLALLTANDQQCSSLAQLTGLQELRVETLWGACIAGVRQLAALEQLTSLTFDDFFELDKFGGTLQLYVFSRLKVNSVQDCYAIINKAPAGHPPDVAAQLLHGCNVADDAVRSRSSAYSTWPPAGGLQGC